MVFTDTLLTTVHDVHRHTLRHTGGPGSGAHRHPGRPYRSHRRCWRFHLEEAGETEVRYGRNKIFILIFTVSSDFANLRL